MAIHRDKADIITFECDGCGDVEETGTESFPDALAHIRAEGWTNGHTGSPPYLKFHHHCRDCSQ